MTEAAQTKTKTIIHIQSIESPPEDFGGEKSESGEVVIEHDQIQYEGTMRQLCDSDNPEAYISDEAGAAIIHSQAPTLQVVEAPHLNYSDDEIHRKETPLLLNKQNSMKEINKTTLSKGPESPRQATVKTMGSNNGRKLSMQGYKRSFTRMPLPQSQEQTVVRSIPNSVSPEDRTPQRSPKRRQATISEKITEVSPRVKKVGYDPRIRKIAQQFKQGEVFIAPNFIVNGRNKADSENLSYFDKALRKMASVAQPRGSVSSTEVKSSQVKPFQVQPSHVKPSQAKPKARKEKKHVDRDELPYLQTQSDNYEPQRVIEQHHTPKLVHGNAIIEQKVTKTKKSPSRSKLKAKYATENLQPAQQQERSDILPISNNKISKPAKNLRFVESEIIDLVTSQEEGDIMQVAHHMSQTDMQMSTEICEENQLQTKKQTSQRSYKIKDFTGKVSRQVMIFEERAHLDKKIDDSESLKDQDETKLDESQSGMLSLRNLIEEQNMRRQQTQVNQVLPIQVIRNISQLKRFQTQNQQKKQVRVKKPHIEQKLTLTESITPQDISNLNLSFLENNHAFLRRQSLEDPEAAAGLIVEKLPVSKIARNFKPLDLHEKRKKMSDIVDSLLKETHGYFSGKQLRIKNKASYFQCVSNPSQPQSYIAAQAVFGATDEKPSDDFAEQSQDQSMYAVPPTPPPPIAQQDFLKIKPILDDNLLLIIDQSDVPTVYYAQTEPGVPQLELDSKSDVTLLSFWSRLDQQVASPEYECTNFITEQNVVKQNGKALFTSSDLSHVFFFSESSLVTNESQLRLNIFQQSHQRRGALTRYLIERNSTLERQLRYQLVAHTQSGCKTQIFSLPPPNIVSLSDNSYLILTMLVSGKDPRIMFFRLQAMKEHDIYSSKGFDDSAASGGNYCRGTFTGQEISGEPTYCIEGGEMFLSADIESNVRFLTSKKPANEAVGLEPEVVRLLYPAIVIEIPFQSLKSQGKASKESQRLLKQWELQSDGKASGFFRSLSHQFSLVMPTCCEQDKNLITLCFSGCDNMPDTAVHFTLREPGEAAAEQSGKNQNVLRGSYTVDEEQVQAMIQIAFTDSSGKQITAMGTEATGREFKVRHEIIGDEWTHTKFCTTQKDNNCHTPPPFNITRLVFEEKSGIISSGSVVYDGEMLTLRQAKKQPAQSANYYPKESSFKLLFGRPSGGDKNEFWAIEGTYLHEPFNTQLFGRFTHMKPTGEVTSGQNFVIQRQQQVRLSFSFREGDQLCFNTEAMSGTVSNRTNQIYMSSNPPESHIVDMVQKVTTNEQGTFVLYGDLANLSAPQKQNRQERMQQDMKLMQVSTSIKRGSKSSQLTSKNMKVTAQASLREILQSQSVFMPKEGLIQTMEVGGSPLTLSMSILLSEEAQSGRQKDFTIKFIEEQLSESNLNADAGLDEGEETTVQLSGLVPQQWASDYPLFAYNSFLPDSSEIIITNMAERVKVSQVLNIGPRWCFISFIESTVLTQALKLSKLDCQIYFLALHKFLKKMFILGVNKDPWSPEKYPEVFIIKTCDIRLPPEPLEKVKGIHLLTRLIKDELEMTLLFQLECQMWAVSLQDPLMPPQPLFDAEEKRMKPRLAVRRSFDDGQLYCLVERMSVESVVKVKLDAKDKVTVSDIFESNNSRLIILEEDPENAQALFVIDEDERISHILDNNEGKAEVLETFDMTGHDLQSELERISQRHWTSVIVSQEMLSIGDFSFSTRTKFFWKDSVAGELVDERNMPDAMLSVQIRILPDDSHLFCLKPLASMNFVDILGQARTNKSTNAYLANANQVLLQTDDQRVIIFDKDGYLCQDDDIIEAISKTEQKILRESVMTKEYGKFFLVLQDKQNLTVMQAATQGGFNEILRIVNGFESIHDSICASELTSLYECLGKASMHSEDDIEGTFQDNLNIKVHHLLTSYGELVLLASTVIEDVDINLTLFEPEHESQQNLKGQQDDFTDYTYPNRLLGFFRLKQISVVIFPCRNKEQQLSLFQEENVGKASRRKAELRQIAEHEHQRSNFTFGIVSTRLVWLDFQRRSVYHIDLEQAVQARPVTGSVKFETLSCRCFTIKEPLSTFNIENYRDSGISIEEVPEDSVLRTKKIPEPHDGDMILVQLTIKNQGIIYNLQPENRYEFAVIADISFFKDPVNFQHTGFVYSTASRKSTSCKDIAIWTPAMEDRLLYRAFSEMELRQVDTAMKIVKKNQQYSVLDISGISQNTIMRQYGSETFFSLFAEETPIHQLAYERLNFYKTSEPSEFAKVQPQLKLLAYVLDRPTPVCVHNRDDVKLANLSIVKQSLLFTQAKAQVSLYKVADLMALDLTDYISCIGDLGLLIEKLPAQQYFRVLNKLQRNFYCRKIKEAIMQKRGNQSTLISFSQKSAVITEYTPTLGLNRTQTDEEVRTSVIVRVLPLQWIDAEGGNRAELFNFMRNNIDKMLGTLLLDAIFNAYWYEQKKKILRWVFMPFVFHFTIANIYYLTMMMEDIPKGLGLFQTLCQVFASEESCADSGKIEQAFRLLFFMTSIHQIFIEVYQAVKEGCLDYVKQLSNTIDVMALGFNVGLIITKTAGWEMSKVRILASIGAVGLWSQMVLWFRLFDTLAQFVDLIFETMHDIRHFLYVLLSIMFMFQSGFFLLGINRIASEDINEEPMYPYDEDQAPLLGSSILNQYFLLLGDFGNMNLMRGYGKYSGSNSAWAFLENCIIIVLFVSSTFLSQIVTLNMLVAIMSSTFDRHSADLHQNEQRQKLVLQSEFTTLLNTYDWAFGSCCKSRKSNQKGVPSDFLFVITRDAKAKKDDGFENGPRGHSKSKEKGRGKGSDGAAVSELKAVLESNFRELDAFLNKKLLNQVQDLAQDMRIRLTNLEKNQQESENNLKKAIFSKMSRLQSKVDQIEKATSSLKNEVIQEITQDVTNQVTNLNKSVGEKMTKNLTKSVEAIRRLQVGQRVGLDEK